MNWKMEIGIGVRLAMAFLAMLLMTTNEARGLYILQRFQMRKS